MLHARGAALLVTLAFAAAGMPAGAAPPAGELYRLACERMYHSDFAAARGLFQRILLDSPGSPRYPDAVFFLSEAELALGDLTSAERHLDVIRDLYPDSPWREEAALLKCRIAARGGRTDEAARLADGVADEYPGGVTAGGALWLAGDALLARGRSTEALAVYPRALAALRGTDAEQGVLHAMGTAELAVGDLADAAVFFSAAVTGPSAAVSESSLYNLAVVLSDLGRREEALAASGSFLSAFPASHRREEAARLRGILVEQAGDLPAARDAWELLVREFPRSPRADEYLYLRGMAGMRLGRPAEALPYFQAVLRDHPGSPLREQSAYGIGVAYARRGELARALTWFPPLFSSPGAAGLAERSRLAAAACSFNLGAYDKALSGFEWLARTASGSRRGSFLLSAARTRYRMERLPEAALEFREASSLLEDPVEAADALYWLGWCQFRMGRLPASADAFLEAAAKSPQGPRAAEALLRAGMGSAGSGDDARAVSLFDSASAAAASAVTGSAAVPAAAAAPANVPAAAATPASVPAAAATESIGEKALYEKALALGRLGRTDAMDAAFDELSRLYPGGRLAAESSFRRASALLGDGRPWEAYPLFQRVVEGSPAGPLAEQAVYWSGEAALGAGEPELAAAAFWESLRDHPAGSLAPSSLEGLERAMAAAADPGLARAYAERAAVERSLSTELCAAVTLACARVLFAPAPQEAAAFVEAAAARPLPEPQAGEAHLLRGQLMESRGEWAAARELFSGLATQRDDRVGARARIGEARSLEALGRTREAADTLVEVASTFRDYPDLCAEALFGAARILRGRGEEGRARAAEQALGARYPESPWAARVGLRKETL
jgi:TolA-binding protein